MTNRVYLGKVVSTFGLRGQLSCLLYSEKPSWTSARLENSASLNVSITKYPYKSNKKMCTCAIDGIKKIEDAKQFIGQKFWVYRSELPAISEDELYLIDLINLPVVLNDEIIGKVYATHDFGAGIILELTIHGLPELMENESESIDAEKPRTEKPKRDKSDSKDIPSVDDFRKDQGGKTSEIHFIHWREIDKIEHKKRIVLKTSNASSKTQREKIPEAAGGDEPQR